MNANLNTRIAIHQGWEANGNVASEPDWTGTVEQYWENNQDLTWGDIREMMSELDFGGSYPVGGGAAPIFTIRLRAA